MRQTLKEYIERVLYTLNSPLRAADEYVQPYAAEKKKYLLEQGWLLYEDNGKWKVKEIQAP